MERSATGISADLGDQRWRERVANEGPAHQLSRALRARWRAASLASGWRFPSDWSLPEVDAVCAAVVDGRKQESALAGLGRARAESGAGLSETLTDLAALHAVLTTPDAVDGLVAPDVDATPGRLLRITAVAWSDVAVDKLTGSEVTDPLTGLRTGAYLRTRLGEIYAQLGVKDRAVSDEYLLLVVSLDLSGLSGWPRLSWMTLVGDALRTVFDGGETLAVLGPSVVTALVRKGQAIATQAMLLRRELTARLATDRQLADVGQPRITTARLPRTHRAAVELLGQLGRH